MALLLSLAKILLLACQYYYAALSSNLSLLLLPLQESKPYYEESLSVLPLAPTRVRGSAFQSCPRAGTSFTE